MQKLILALGMLVFFTNINAQNTQPYRKHGQGCKEDLFNVQDKQTRLWGYRSFEGEWVIPANYVEAGQFASGKAKVKKGDKWGVVNCTGYLIINCEYEEIKDFSGDKIWAKKGNLWGLLSEKGQILVPHLYDDVQKIGFENSVSWVRKGDLWGIIDESNSKTIVKNIYEDFTVASDQISIVKLKDSLGLIENYTGKLVIEPKITDMEKISNHCFAYKLNNKWGAVSHLGDKNIPCEYDKLSKWNNGLILAQKSNKFKILNDKGKSISSTYDFIGPVVNNRAICMYQNQFGYINEKATLVVKPNYVSATNFYFNTAIVKSKSGYQIINMSGKNLTNESFEFVRRDSSKGYFWVKNQANNYLLNTFGIKQNLDFDKLLVNSASEGILFYKNNKMGAFNILNNKIILPVIYDSISTFRVVEYQIFKNDKKGIATAEGKELIPCEYDFIDYYSIDGKVYYYVQKDIKVGLLNNQNQTVVELKYDLLAPANNKNLIAKLEDNYGMINLKSEIVIPFKYDYLSNILEEKNNFYQPLVYKKGKKSGLLNLKGDEVVTTEGSINFIGENLYALSENGKVKIINHKGENINKEEFQQIGEFINRIAKAKKNDKWGYITLGGKFFIQPVYDQVEDFKSKTAVVKQGNKYGIIDFMGKTIVPIEYDEIYEQNGNRILVKDNTKFYLNKFGKIKNL
ncbi:MAG: WG repeat-containing protein [Cytophagales bacterium]